jgi:Tfp pilus assembly protein PilO
VSITDRDRKILMVIVPLVLIAGYWFLLLAPKREEAATAGDTLAKAEQRLDAAEALVQQKESARSSFASDYSELIRLGKAIPTSVDMPSLIVQLDSAARGTHIKFRKISTSSASGGPTAPAAASTPPPASGNGSQPAQGGNATQPAAAGGQPAQSGPGKAAETAGNAANASNASSAQSSGVDAKDAQTSTSAREGLPVGGGSAASSAGAAQGGQTCAPGLVCVPLTMEFNGGFFDLTDFFHRLKRFVKLENRGLRVSGRLMTIDSLKFATDQQSFPSLKAEIGATVYLAPKSEGTTAGATAQGPADTTPAGGSQPAGAAPTTPASTNAAPGSTTPTP